MTAKSTSKRPIMKISLPPHAEEAPAAVVHPSISAKGPGGSAKSQHVEMPQKEKKKESPFAFSVDVLTSAITLPVTERTPARISMHLKEKYKLESEFMIELYTLTKVPPHATINENERIGCLIRNSNFSSSYLEYLVEQNRQLAANLDNSQEAVVALAAEVEKLTKRLAGTEDASSRSGSLRPALDSPSEKHRKSSKKHRVRADGTEPSSTRRKSGKKSGGGSSHTHSAVMSPADVIMSKPAPMPTSTSATTIHTTPVRENSDRAIRGSGLPRSPGARSAKDDTITTVTRTETPPKRSSDSGADKKGVQQDVAPGTTITTITTTTIITKQQTTAPSPVVPSPGSPRVAAKQQRPRKSVPGLDLQQSLRSPVVQRGSSGGSGLAIGAGSSSPTVRNIPVTKSPPSTAHAPERDKFHPVMLSDRSGGSHHCFDVDGKLGACRNCPVRCTAFKAQASGPSWMCGDCGHLNIKHLGSPRNSQP